MQEDRDFRGAHTIEQVSEFLKVPPRQLVKTLIYKDEHGGSSRPLVRGDHEVNEPQAPPRGAGRVAPDGDARGDPARKTGGPLGFLPVPST